MNRPNFLILFSDQQRYDTINAAGYKHMITPNIDRLVNEGCLFANAYSPNPVCMPARHYLITGNTARVHGYFSNCDQPIEDEGIPTIPQILSDHGYVTCAVGKMHFYPPRRHHGFDEMHLMEELPRFREEDEYLQYLDAQGYKNLRNIHGVRPHCYHYPQRALMPEKHHGTSWVAERAIKFLSENKTRPFFLMCGWIKPHPPWNIPEEWDGLYSTAKLPEPIPRSREFPYYSGESDWFGDNDSEELRRQIREAYYTSISMVDRNVGKILDYMEKNNILDNTFIIYTSDHGEMLQDKGFYQKALPYESASRIPFVIRYPKKFEKGSRENAFVDLMDIFPTILEEAGIDYYYKDLHKRYSLAGASLLNIRDPQAKKDRTYQFVDCGKDRNRWIFVRDVRYKYIYFYNGGTEQFYDLQNDPGELNNLINSHSLPVAEHRRLKTKAIEYEQKFGPANHIKDGDFIKFDAREIPPYDFNAMGKFPLWANHQFQYFGEEDPGLEARIYIDEIKMAMSKYLDKDPDFLKKVLPDKKWRSYWFENFKKLGGNENGKLEIMGEL